MRRERFPVSRGRAGVEEIVGFAGSFWGPAGVVRICFWVPGPPPATWSRAVFRVSPWGGRPAGVPCPDRFLGAWWFENWIVDASNAMNSVSSFALSRFRQALLLESGFEIDRFVIIVYSVMICRLAWRSLSSGFFGACAALKGVWWMPWQTVPMKDV